MSSERLLQCCYTSLSSLSEAEAAEVERRTRGQSDNTDWRMEGSRRLTASNFGRVGKLKASTSRHNTVLSILYPEDISRLPAVIHGRESEERALAQLSEVLGRADRGLTTCGLFIDCNTGYLAASPDGILDQQVRTRRRTLFFHQTSPDVSGDKMSSQMSGCIHRGTGND